MLGLGKLQRLYLNLKAPDGASFNGSWQRCRRAFLKQVGKKCVCCNSKKKIEVHHILPRHIRPDLALDVRNLIALCGGGNAGCHLRLGHLGSYFNYNETIAKVSWFVRHYSILRKNK